MAEVAAFIKEQLETSGLSCSHMDAQMMLTVATSPALLDSDLIYIQNAHMAEMQRW